MKNLKNTITTVGLMAVLGMGTTMANAGILISDKASQTGGTEPAKCSATTTNGVMSAITGLIVVGLNGLILSDGLLLSDAPCRSGILISDKSENKDGILISDKATNKDGILISD